MTKADKMLGVEAEVLDIHDGELMPTLENRKTFVRLIREWKAETIQYAEAFELCEYGRQPAKEELKKLFLLP